jgi:hypothetical protein
MTEMEMSPEEQIAEHYVAPAPEKRICQWGAREGIAGCTTPLANSNKGNLCYRHAQMDVEQRRLSSFSRTTRPEDAWDHLVDCRFDGCKKKMSPDHPTGLCRWHSAPPVAKVVTPIAPIKAIEPIKPIEQLQPIAPQPEMKEEERTPMTTSNEDPKHFRTCAVKDCEEAIGAHNSSGRCTGHFYIKRGMVMKDGSIPKPHTPLSATMKRAEIKNAAAGTTGKKKHKPALPAPTVLPPEPKPAVVCADDSHVSLKVPIERLDAFLMKLPIEDKIRIAERELFGGW